MTRAAGRVLSGVPGEATDAPDAGGGRTPARPISGAQYALARGSLRAVIASVGASLREFRDGDRDLVVPFAADALRPGYRGATVAPWPNRVVDGRFTWNGEEHQAPITEVGRHHALHGLTPWLDFGLVRHDASELELSATIEPQAGYPWRIRVETRFVLDADGLTQTVTATHLAAGCGSAPYGVCPHPYLVGGSGPLDAWRLSLPADRVLLVDDERLVPGALAEVSSDPARFDFRSPRAIGDAAIDHAFTGVHWRDGAARVEVLGPDGAGAAMVWGADCPWVQIHTADAPDPAEASHRVGLAVEPMTCAPDAFNGGPETGVIALAPGATHRTGWRIETVRAAR